MSFSQSLSEDTILFLSPHLMQSTLRSFVSSLRISIESREEGLHRNGGSLKKQMESDSSAYGTYGLIEIQPDALEYLEKISKPWSSSVHVYIVYVPIESTYICTCTTCMYQYFLQH